MGIAYDVDVDGLDNTGNPITRHAAVHITPDAGTPGQCAIIIELPEAGHGATNGEGYAQEQPILVQDADGNVLARISGAGGTGGQSYHGSPGANGQTLNPGVAYWAQPLLTACYGFIATMPEGTTGAGFVTNGWIDVQERASDPPAPPANTARFFVRDNGSGKTQYCVRFNTGAVQVLATQP